MLTAGEYESTEGGKVELEAWMPEPHEQLIGRLNCASNCTS